MLATSIAGGDVARVGAVFSVPVCVIRGGLPAMLADDLFTCSAGSGFVMHQPEFIPTGIRAETARPVFTRNDRLSALRAYGLRAFRSLSADGIPVAIGFDSSLRNANGKKEITPNMKNYTIDRIWR